jgi:hypothetical protein
MIRNLTLLAFFLYGSCLCQNLRSPSASLVSVVYDFDGLDVGQTDLPDGDYGNGDLSYAIAANPLVSDVTGDRSLRISLGWQSGQGEFGKATMRFVELNASADYLNFYIYNTSSSGNAVITVVIAEDDDADDFFNGAVDDKWAKDLTIASSPSWQLVSIPLSGFYDANPGNGNGVFDAAYSNAAGMLFTVGFIFKKPQATSVSDAYYIDMICFSNGPMPVGSSATDLPFSSGACRLGALSGSNPGQTPAEVEGYLPDGKRLSFVNWFLYYSKNGSTPDEYPGPEVQSLLDNGYIPIITWEMMYQQYSRLDPVQPRLDNLLNGSFDGYIDAFAAKIRSYSGTVIMRIFHEFEGDWYPWSLTQNGKDPAKYKAAFRHVVDRFRAAGATNVQWMWCLNAEPKPYKAYNWVVNCYPGDDYVDIVATDVYNHPDYGTPAWKSFRYTMAESYYYLTKFYPHKPLYICEVGCRERNGSESGGSQSKADWICAMNKDLQSYFSKAQALVFFSMVKEHDWRINSSTPALDAFIGCIWNSNYYGHVVDIQKNMDALSFTTFPSPFTSELNLSIEGLNGTARVRLFDMLGKVLHNRIIDNPFTRFDLAALPNGLYVIEVASGSAVRRQKIIRTSR